MEDDRKTADLVALYLRHDGHAVTLAHSGTDALARLARDPFDLLVLDVMLPGASGLEICQAVRAHSRVPIILLTARSEETQRLDGFALGADDYVSKPFSPRELAARVRALLRRAPPSGERVLRFRDLALDVMRRTATLAGAPLDLTPSELAVLEALMERPGHVRSRRQLLERLPTAGGDALERTIDVHVRNLRRKLDAAGASADYVATALGAGYRMGDGA